MKILLITIALALTANAGTSEMQTAQIDTFSFNQIEIDGSIDVPSAIYILDSNNETLVSLKIERSPTIPENVDREKFEEIVE